MPQKLIIGLYLPKTYGGVAGNVKKGDLDLLVYPENHDEWQNRKKWEAHSRSIATPILVGLRDNRGAQLGFFYDPKTDFSYTYTKHSTAGYIAFQDRNWSPDNNLKIVELNDFKIGITICHDMYLSLLMRYLAKLGADVLINPSGTRVKRKKWATILRARAIENQGYTLCTLHDVGSRANQGHVFGFSPIGKGLKFTNIENRKEYTSFETTSENVYVTEIRKEEVINAKRIPHRFPSTDVYDEIPKASSAKTKTTLTCKVSGEILTCQYSSSSFQIKFQNDPIFFRCGNEKIGVIPLKANELLQPEKIFSKISSCFSDSQFSKLLFWNHWKNISQDEYARCVLPIVLARVIEWCSPFIVSRTDSSRVEGFEIANSSKAVHRVNVLDGFMLFELRRAWGIRSAFKMCNVKNFVKFKEILRKISPN